MALKRPGMRGGMVSRTIKDKQDLYLSYLPFLKNGGLFIPTEKQYNLGDEVFMLLTLPEDHDKNPVAGKVVWINHKGTQGNRPAGIGVQFGEQDGGKTRSKIEILLGGLLKSDKPTFTM
jgi:type IV pilus assembly protein PilZ